MPVPTVYDWRANGEGPRAYRFGRGIMFGITDVRFVRAEGVGMGPDAKAQAFANAERDIQAHASTAANQPQVAAVA